MNDRKTSNIQLPTERVAQLAELRLELGGTTSAAIGQLLAWARESGRVKHGIPGVTINAFSDGLAIGLAETKATGFTADEADGLVKNIRELAAAGGGRIIDLDANYGIARKGSGIVLTINGVTKSFSLDVALELADLIETFLKDA